MKKRYLSILAMAVFVMLIYSCTQKTEEKQEQQQEAQITLRVSPLTGSPAFADASLALDGAPSLDGHKLSTTFTVENYQLGVQTPGAGENGLANSGKGQHIHYIADNGPYSAHYEPSAEKELEAGNHVILAFLSRSFHESVKNPQSFVLFQSQIGGEGEELDLSGPQMFYSRPKGVYKGDAAKKVMLDFFLVNSDLSADGFKVRATISGEGYEHIETFTRWQPYVIEGLPIGEVKLKLEFLDAAGNLVKSTFNPVERSITLAEADAS